MNGRKIRTKERFLSIIGSDIITGIIGLLLVMAIPYMLAINFSPNLISEYGLFVSWAYWFAGIVVGSSLLTGIYGLIEWWIDSRWAKAKKEVEKNDRR